MPRLAETLRGLMNRSINADQVLPLFAQVLDGVEAAHLLGVIHRDIKPENILHHPHESRLLIADFGIAHFEEEELLRLLSRNRTIDWQTSSMPHLNSASEMPLLIVAQTFLHLGYY